MSNLPANRSPLALDLGHRPLKEQGVLDKRWSGYVARVNAETVERYSKEVQARISYAQELKRLTEACLERDRAIAHYVYDRDTLIANDRQEHEHRLELDQLRRERELQQAQHESTLAMIKHEAALHETLRRSARARWGYDAFQQSLPHREARLDHLFKTGALDAEIEMLLSNEQRSKLTGSTAVDSNQSDTLTQLLQTLEQEIDLSRARHASPDVMLALEGFRARLQSLLEAEKKAGLTRAGSNPWRFAIRVIVLCDALRVGRRARPFASGVRLSACSPC